MADTDFGARNVVIKVTGAILADTNVPGLLRAIPSTTPTAPKQGEPVGPAPDHWLDYSGAGGGEVYMSKNGVPLIAGKNSSATCDYYPGTDPSNGDVMFKAALAVDDMLLIEYGRTAYREIS